MERKNDQLLTAFALVLRRKRHAAGLSQEDLAARSDISTRHISHLETMRRQPTLTIFAALCYGLDVTMIEFSGDLEEEVARVGHAQTQPVSGNNI